MRAPGDAARQPRRLGVIVPSSNTVAEAGTLSVLAGADRVVAHFTRLRVVSVSDDDGSLAQFDEPGFAAAADLLADAGVDLMLWQGTSSSWLGWKADERITASIGTRCGVPAMTATTAINRRLSRMGARRIGLVTPYVEGLERRIARNYGDIGIEVAAAARLDLTVNTEYAKVPPARLAAMAAKVAEASPDAIVVLCTNLAGASIADAVAASTGIPILDSVRVAAEEAVAVLGGQAACEPAEAAN
jgi:maleate isomerase